MTSTQTKAKQAPRPARRPGTVAVPIQTIQIPEGSADSIPVTDDATPQVPEVTEAADMPGEACTDDPASLAGIPMVVAPMTTGDGEGSGSSDAPGTDDPDDPDDPDAQTEAEDQGLRNLVAHQARRDDEEDAVLPGEVAVPEAAIELDGPQDDVEDMGRHSLGSALDQDPETSIVDSLSLHMLSEHGVQGTVHLDEGALFNLHQYLHNTTDCDHDRNDYRFRPRRALSNAMQVPGQDAVGDGAVLVP